ncbi:MAG: hypothetical protein PHV02_08220 [Rhodocyclaceae bacterium]|nr:hypothetical protein [Rhodocyclaceae bacterium]
MNFYDDIEGTKDLVPKLFAKDPDGSLQRTQVSELAPSPVSDEELLTRSLEYPSRFTPNGELNESFFEHLYTSGTSVQRLVYGWDYHSQDVHDRFEKRAYIKRNDKPIQEHVYVGALQASAGELRNFAVDDESIKRVRVYDHAREDDILHAEVIADIRNLNKIGRKKFRIQLMCLFLERGLWVSPFLAQENQYLLSNCGCNLHKSQVKQLGGAVESEI